MQEFLYEESAKCQNEKEESRKYKILLTFSILTFFICIVCFFIMINFMNLYNNWLINLFIYVLPIIILLTAGIVLIKLKNKFCVDYDYIFASGSIRISKVINNSIRQTIFRFNCSQIEKIGAINSKIFNTYLNSGRCKINILSSNNEPEEGKEFYYIVFNQNSLKYLLVLECSKLFIINVLKYSNRVIRDEELK